MQVPPGSHCLGPQHCCHWLWLHLLPSFQMALLLLLLLLFLPLLVMRLLIFPQL
jgi:hypothetical protein